MILSEELTSWRIDRPDEWKMDEFIQKAKQLEEALATLPLKQQGEPVSYRCKWKDGILPDGHPQNGWQITDWIHPSNRDSMIIEPLYTSAPTIPEGMAKDAARYRWVRDNSNTVNQHILDMWGETKELYPLPDEWDAAIDKAILSAAPAPEVNEV